MKKCLAGKSDRSSGQAVKPQDSWSHYKRRGTQGKAQPKPWSDTSKGLEHHSPPGHLEDASQSGGLLWSSLYPRSWQQKEVAVPIHFRRGSPGSVVPATQGPRYQGAQVDKAGDPLYPLGQAETGRAQESENCSTPGCPTRSEDQCTCACP